MPRFERKEAIAVGALLLVLTTCGLAVTVSIGTWSAARQELSDKRELLSRLEARSRSAAKPRDGLRAGEAPASAFLAAPTAGLAGAALQSYFARLVSDQRGVLVSAGVQPAARDDAPDTIRVQATLNTTIKGLQTLLYQLESGTPYVFVDQLSVQQPGTSRGAADPELRVTLGVRAVWRKADA